jgi:GTP-binding protein HflX
VGFIRELPHELVAAFQSTLTEAREATLLLHVIDASDPRRDERIDQVNAVLQQVGAGELPQIRVFNKIDRLQQTPRIERDAEGVITHAWVSAVRAEGLDGLMQAIAERLSRFARPYRLRVGPAHAGRLRAKLIADGVLQGERSTEAGALELDINVPEPDAQALAALPDVELLDAPAQSAAQLEFEPCATEGGYLQSPLNRVAS